MSLLNNPSFLYKYYIVQNVFFFFFLSFLFEWKKSADHIIIISNISRTVCLQWNEQNTRAFLSLGVAEFLSLLSVVRRGAASTPENPSSSMFMHEVSQRTNDQGMFRGDERFGGGSVEARLNIHKCAIMRQIDKIFPTIRLPKKRIKNIKRQSYECFFFFSRQ